MANGSTGSGTGQRSAAGVAEDTVAFAKQSYHEKQNVILNCFVKDRNIVRDITNGKFLETVDLKMLPEEISHAVLDEAVDIHMIR